MATDTPEIVVDLDVVRANVERIAAQAAEAGVSLRPHTKTHKLPQIARIQLDAGAAGVQVAKLGEAEVMADAGVDDILVGYPIVGERKLQRLADLAERATISVTVDSERGRARALAHRARARPDVPRPARTRHRHAPVGRPPRARGGGWPSGSRRSTESSSRASSPTRATSTRRRATRPSASA